MPRHWNPHHKIFLYQSLIGFFVLDGHLMDTCQHPPWVTSQQHNRRGASSSECDLLTSWPRPDGASTSLRQAPRTGSRCPDRLGNDGPGLVAVQPDRAPSSGHGCPDSSRQFEDASSLRTKHMTCQIVHAVWAPSEQFGWEPGIEADTICAGWRIVRLQTAPHATCRKVSRNGGPDAKNAASTGLTESRQESPSRSTQLQSEAQPRWRNSLSMNCTR
jgi:hypothetical protein